MWSRHHMVLGWGWLKQINLFRCCSCFFLRMTKKMSCYWISRSCLVSAQLRRIWMLISGPMNYLFKRENALKRETNFNSSCNTVPSSYVTMFDVIGLNCCYPAVSHISWCDNKNVIWERCREMCIVVHISGYRFLQQNTFVKTVFIIRPASSYNLP